MKYLTKKILSEKFFKFLNIFLIIFKFANCKHRQNFSVFLEIHSFFKLTCFVTTVWDKLLSNVWVHFNAEMNNVFYYLGIASNVRDKFSWRRWEASLQSSSNSESSQLLSKQLKTKQNNYLHLIGFFAEWTFSKKW